MTKIVVVLGASGIIGSGFIKACLESSHNIKAVGVFRSEQSAEATKALLGNPSEDKFITVIGNLESGENAVELRESILSKAGEITDVVASIGAWKSRGQMLSLSFETVEQDFSNKLRPHFLCAKTFIPYLCDKPDTSYTLINGGAARVHITTCGTMTMSNAALTRMAKAIFYEHRDKSVRLNEFMIAQRTSMWTNVPANAVSNIEMGKAILGVIIFPTARGLSLLVKRQHMESIAKTGITDSVNDIPVVQF